MKTPLPLGEGELTSIICALLKERGLDSFTLSLEDFDKLNLGAYGLECTGDIDDNDSDTVLSMTVSIVKV